MWTAPVLMTPGHLRCGLAMVVVTRTNRWLFSETLSFNCFITFTKYIPDISGLCTCLSYFLCIC
jgi:hypothetical protein